MAEGGDTSLEEQYPVTAFPTPTTGIPVEDSAAQSSLGSASTVTKAITSDPRKLTVKADVAAEKGTGTDIAAGAGQAGATTTATTTTAEQAPDAVASTATDTATVDPTAAAGAVDASLEGATAATGALLVAFILLLFI